MHASNNRHHRQSPISCYATFEHTKRPRLHPGLLDNEPTVTRGAKGHLSGHCANKGCKRDAKRAGDARGQQVRRDERSRGVDGRRREARPGLALHANGDVGQDERERQGGLSAAALDGHALQHEHRLEA